MVIRTTAHRSCQPPPEFLLQEFHDAADALQRIRAKFPTGAVAVLSVAGGGWRDLDADCAQLTDFVVPRDLDRRHSAGRLDAREEP